MTEKGKENGDKKLLDAADNAEKKFDERLRAVIGRNITAMPKGDFLKESLEYHFKEDVNRIYTMKQYELNELKEKHKQDSGTVTAEYQNAKKEIRKKHKQELAELHERYTSTLKAYGNKEGEKRKIDTKSEVYDFAKYGLSVLTDMNLSALVNEIAGEDLHTKYLDTKDTEMFPIIEKISKKQKLEQQDFDNIAERLTDISEIDVTKLALDPKDMEKTLRTVSKTSVFSAAMLLERKDRMSVGQSLIDKHGEKGAMIVHQMTLIDYFSVMQAEELFKGRTEGPAYEAHKDAMKGDKYSKAHEEINELKAAGLENMELFFHNNFANHMLSYKNVLNYEIFARAAIAVAVLNIVVNAKNKDPEAILFNAPMWVGLGASAYIYNDITEGGIERLATKDSKEEAAAKEKLRKEKEFATRFTTHPQLARWFVDNLDEVQTGFTKKNPKKENGQYTIKFEDMGVPNPGEKDGRRGGALEKTISSWHRELYFDLEKKDNTPSEEVRIQKEYLTDIINNQV